MDDGHVNDGEDDDDDDDDDDDAVDENEVTDDMCDKHESGNVDMSDPRKASAEILRRDQRLDRSLNKRANETVSAHAEKNTQNGREGEAPVREKM